MGVRKEKSEWCLECKKSFGDVPRRAKNLCNVCYYKLQKPQKPEYDACVDCEIKWGELNKKGKVVNRSTSVGLCKSCYMKRYSSKMVRLCLTCNEPILNRTSRDVCKRCFMPSRKQTSMLIKRAAKEKKDINEPTREDYEDLRKLLNRYKWGVNTEIDPYKVADHFTSMICKETLIKYDGMEVESQIIYMLKDLKEKYNEWRESNNKKISYSSKR